MKERKKICVVTGSRADYGHLRWLLQEISDDTDLQLQIIVTGMHLSPLFGLTYRGIEEDGFRIDEKISMPLNDDSVIGITRAMGEAIGGFGEVYSRLKPHWVVLFGDRYEMVVAALAATVARLPIAHIHGGESTVGAFDESFRHAITKMALLHFAAAEPYRRNIIQMGESPDRVFFTGAPGLDHLNRTKLLGRSELENELRVKLGDLSFLITYHPVTLEDRSSGRHMKELLDALHHFPEATLIFTGTNADPDNRVIPVMIESFLGRRKGKGVYSVSLGQHRYLSCLREVDLVIGNSSSGLIEAPSFGVPTVNIGDRQRGRLQAESVISCQDDQESILKAIEKGLQPAFREGLSRVHNPYGEPGASRKIRDILKDYSLTENSLKKEFFQL